MRGSVDTFLATHTGSLPRPPDIVEMLFPHKDGKPTRRRSRGKSGQGWAIFRTP